MAAKGLDRGVPPLVLLSTAGSLPEARRLAKLLLRRRLAACVNIVPRVDSWYWWKGKVAHGGEFLLLIKTSRRQLPQIGLVFKSHHSYDLPELIALPISWGEKRYLQWLAGSMELSADH